jgi:FAD/FMN-containing dehydrogenase
MVFQVRSASLSRPQAASTNIHRRWFNFEGVASSLVQPGAEELVFLAVLRGAFRSGVRARPRGAGAHGLHRGRAPRGTTLWNQIQS